MSSNGTYLKPARVEELFSVETVSFSQLAIPEVASDALHIASARAAFASARRERIATGRFVTADTGLAAAATWAGLPVANPEDNA